MVSRRFERFSFQFILERQIIFLFAYVLEFIPIPLSFNQLYLYNLLLIDYTNSYKTFRHLFNLPVNGQRTWGGGKSIKIMKSHLYNFKIKKFLKHTNSNSMFFTAETINLLWKNQWLHEWLYSRKYEAKLPWYVKRKRKYVAISEMASRRVQSFFNHPFKNKKKKSHRKKKTINKNVLTTGFNYGFSYLYKNNLL